MSRPYVKEAGKEEVTHRAFNMTDEGDLSDYLGVKIEQLPNGTIKLSQPHLIQQILDDLGFNERTGTKTTPASTTVKLNHRGAEYKEDWQYMYKKTFIYNVSTFSSSFSLYYPSLQTMAGR